MAISPTNIRILFTNYDIIAYFLNLASCSEHFISIKHQILATFNINKKNQSERLYAFNQSRIYFRIWLFFFNVLTFITETEMWYRINIDQSLAFMYVSHTQSNFQWWRQFFNLTDLTIYCIALCDTWPHIWFRRWLW